MKKIGIGNKVYLAYGSNLNLEQMGYRCPYAVPLGTAVLTDYRLLFRGGKDSAVATVEPETGCSVPVLLWEITPRDEQALNVYEGWPRLYRKETVTVLFDSKPLKAMVYIMNEGYRMGAPSSRYLDTICEGYLAAGFEAEPLKEAVTFSIDHLQQDQSYPTIELQTLREMILRVLSDSQPHSRQELISCALNEFQMQFYDADQRTTSAIASLLKKGTIVKIKKGLYEQP